MRERSTPPPWNLAGQRGCRLRFRVVPFFGEFVLDLLQEPILTRSVSHSGFYDCPFSPRFRAVQGESHEAAAERGRRVGSFRSDHRILAEVPHDDFARPVLTFRKGFLEQKVVERVILNMDREALYLRIFAWPLRHRPGDEGRPNFQPEVIVEIPCPVFLDSEPESRSGSMSRFGDGWRIHFDVPEGLQVSVLLDSFHCNARGSQSLRSSDSSVGVSLLSFSRSDSRRRRLQTARMSMNTIAATTPTRRTFVPIPKSVSGNQPGVVPGVEPAVPKHASGAKMGTLLVPYAESIPAFS